MCFLMWIVESLKKKSVKLKKKANKYDLINYKK